MKHATIKAGDTSQPFMPATVRELDTGGQFVVWALRQRHLDGHPHSEMLVRGFLLAVGLARIERALASFEALFQALDAFPHRSAVPAPLCRPQLSEDEVILTSMFAYFQAGQSMRSQVRAPSSLPAECWLVLSNALTDLAGLMSVRELSVHATYEAPRHGRAERLMLH